MRRIDPVNHGYDGPPTMKANEPAVYGVTKIAQLFPSIRKIKNKSLREKVAAVWSEAITTGCGGKGWTFAELARGKVHAAGRRHRHEVRRASEFLRAAVHRHRRYPQEILPLQHSHSAGLSHRGRALGRCGQTAGVRQGRVGQRDSGKIWTTGAPSI
jgi:hypothetical protein